MGQVCLVGMGGVAMVGGVGGMNLDSQSRNMEVRRLNDH